MFGWVELLRDPERLRLVDRTTLDLAAELIRQLRSGRRIPVRDAPGIPRLVYPRDPRSYAEISRELGASPDSSQSRTRLVALQRTLTAPHMGARHALRRRSPDEAGVERAALAKAFLLGDDDRTQVLFATLSLDATDTGRPDQAVLSLDYVWVDGEDVDQVCLTLEETYLAADPAYHTVGHASGRALRRVVWFGGSTDVERKDWRLRVRAAGRARDLDTLIVDQPFGLRPQELRAAVQDGAPIAHVVWVPKAGGLPAVERVTSIAGLVPVLSIDAAPFEEAIVGFRRILESLPADSPVADLVVAMEAPAPGEVRFYKKIASFPQRDVVVEVRARPSCGWTAVHGGGPKARKGISRLAGTEPDAMWHCDRCEGGGHWMARF